LTTVTIETTATTSPNAKVPTELTIVCGSEQHTFSFMSTCEGAGIVKNDRKNI